MELKPGYKQADVGIIPKDWDDAAIGDVAEIHVGRDLREDKFSTVCDSIYRFPVYSNTVADSGLYGFYSIPEYEGDSLTVVGRGVGLGTAFARTGGYGAIGRLLVLFPNHRTDARFLATYINQRVRIFIETGGIPQLTGIQFAKYRVALPPIDEQHAIADALSDVDALLGTLDRLILKKRDLKQAAMHQLLAGQTRLPGFRDEWRELQLSSVADVLKGRGLSKLQISSSGKRPCILYGELFTIYGQMISDVVGRTSANDGIRSVAGDVLMPGSTTTTGIDLATASALLKDDVALGGDINIIRRKGNAYNSVFLANYLTHEKRREIAEISQGITIYHL